MPENTSPETENNSVQLNDPIFERDDNSLFSRTIFQEVEDDMREWLEVLTRYSN